MDQTPSLRRALIGLALVITAIVGGYLLLKSASDDAVNDAPDTADTSSAPATVRFVRSGGWTGSVNTLELMRDGTGTLRGNDVEKKRIIINIGRARGVELFRQLDDAWPKKVKTFDQNCADCYLYDVAYKGVLLTFYGEARGRFSEPISQLSRIMDRNTKL
ncbi:MAG TPA: hypothetical protein VEV82_04050 [Actinomycetota bacterium]|nr:hypothetical protein [Actinomycetota bacterium]